MPFCFTTTFVNTVPHLKVANLPNIDVQVGATYTYDLNSYIVDDEGHPITSTVVESVTGLVPVYIIQTGNSLAIAPTASDLGDHIINVELSDTDLTSIIYQFTVTFTSSGSSAPPSP